MLKPTPLKNKDKAVIISPSGCIDEKYIDSAKHILEKWGLEVSISKYAKGHCGRFSGTVDERLFDLQSAMDDEDVKLIFCSRGGYGIVQLLDNINFTKIKQFPKWLVGYSDITALHLAFLQNGLVSLHAPMAKHLTEEENDCASKYLKQSLFQGLAKYDVASHNINRIGNIQGRLFGGNLAVLSALIGTKYMNTPDNVILFIEDIAEAPYKIDRMMWQLKLSGILDKLSGLIIGQFTECQEDPLMGRTIYESIKKMVADSDFPIAFNFPVGHVKENYPLLHASEVKFCVGHNNVILEFKQNE